MVLDIMINLKYLLIENLKNLLYEQKYSIEGANKQLSRKNFIC